MSAKKILIILLLLLICVMLGYQWRTTRLKSQTPSSLVVPSVTPVPTTTPAFTPRASESGKLAYTSTQYRYSFLYPEKFAADLSMEMGSPIFYKNQVQFGIVTMQRLATSSDILSAVKSYVGSLCSSDGPMGSTYCPEESMSLQAFTNAQGVSGFKGKRIMKEELYREPASIKQVSQTFYVFPLQGIDGVALVVSPTISAETDIESIHAIADSVQLE